MEVIRALQSDDQRLEDCFSQQTLKHLVGMTYGHLKGYCRSFVCQIHDNLCQTVVTIILSMLWSTKTETALSGRLLMDQAGEASI